MMTAMQAIALAGPLSDLSVVEALKYGAMGIMALALVATFWLLFEAQRRGDVSPRGLAAIKWFGGLCAFLVLGAIVLELLPKMIQPAPQKPQQTLKEVVETASKADLLAIAELLAERGGYYRIENEALVTRLEELCPPAPRGSLAVYVAAIAKCDLHPVLGKLRALARDRQGPFQRRAVQVAAGVPSLAPPRRGEVYCQNGSELDGKRLQILGPTAQVVEALARSAFECPIGATCPDIQLSREDSNDLFGRPTQKYEVVSVIF